LASQAASIELTRHDDDERICADLNAVDHSFGVSFCTRAFGAQQ